MGRFSADQIEAARRLLDTCRERGLTIATAESCTGGLVAGLLTEIAGSSAVVDCGFVTYSNGAKTRMLGVPSAMIEAHGAVSAQVAAVMAEGAVRLSGASIAVAITGIAGPGGGSADKPVGTVHFASAGSGDTINVVRSFGDIGRDAVRDASVLEAIRLLSEQTDRQAAGDTP